jgi:microcystin-dependent protein
MVSTYSPSLRITLIGDGEQSGTWGATTNTNLGSLLEQAITGVQTITLSGTSYTLSAFDGSTDESRNQVLIFSGSLAANCTVTAPSVEKTYVVVNNTTGGFAVNMNTASGTPLAVLSGRSTYMYCDSTNFYSVGSANSIDGNLDVTGNASIGGNLNVTGTINASNVGIIPGGILMWPTAVAPSGFLLCNGAGIATATYPALFATIGYTFGGAGSVFNLPNYVDRMPIGAGNLYSAGTTGGSNTTTITSTNMPAHTHTFSASASGGGSGSFSGQTDGVGDHVHGPGSGGNFMGSGNSGGQGRTDAAQATNFSTTGGGGAHSHSYSGSVYVPVSLSMSGTTSSTGSGAAFTTISPYLGMYFIIKT